MPFLCLSNIDKLFFRAFGEVELQNFNNLLVELRTLVATNRCAILQVVDQHCITDMKALKSVRYSLKGDELTH